MARAAPKTKTPPRAGGGVRVINNSRRRKTAPGNFTTSTTVKLDRLSAPGKRDGYALREPSRLALPERFSTIRARHPEGISIADEERIRAAINARIPRPTKRELQGAIDALVRQVDAISRAA